jgi:hypothetical protein
MIMARNRCYPPRTGHDHELAGAVFAPEKPARPRRVLSLGEAKWDKAMGTGHLERLRRARDLLAVKGTKRSRRDSLVTAGCASILSWPIAPQPIR